MDQNYTLQVAPNLQVTNDFFLRRSHIDLLPIGVLFWSVSGTLVDINRTADRLLEEHAAEFFSILQKEYWQKSLQNACQGHTGGWCEFDPLLHGKKLYIRFLPVRNFAYEMVGVVGYLTLTHPEQPMRPLVKEAVPDDVYDGTHDVTMQAIGEMASGMAHEMRNLLTTARGYLQLVSRNLDKGGRKQIQFAMDEIDRAVELTRSILSVIQRKGQEQVDVESIFAELRVLFEKKVASKQVDVTFEFAADNLTISCDRDKLKQVLLNLVQNALQAVGDSGRVRVRAMRLASEGAKHDKILICVDDSGPGIPPANRERIFEPFFTTKNTGTGLGLAISRQFVREWGGELYLEDPERPDMENDPVDRLGGAVFCVELPAG